MPDERAHEEAGVVDVGRPEQMAELMADDFGQLVVVKRVAL